MSAANQVSPRAPRSPFSSANTGSRPHARSRRRRSRSRGSMMGSLSRSPSSRSRGSMMGSLSRSPSSRSSSRSTSVNVPTPRSVRSMTSSSATPPPRPKSPAKKAPSRSPRHRSPAKKAPSRSPSRSPQLIINPETEELSPDIIAQRCKKIPEISNSIHPFYVLIKGIRYYCTACITYNQLDNISMFTQNSYDNTYIFLTIDASGDGEIIKTRSSPKILPGFKNQLDSIMYISTCMYKMLGIMERSFMDIASGKCDTQPDDKYHEYNLFSYRLFSIDEKTNQPYSLDNLSIYYKYFKRADGSLTETLRFLENPELTTKMNELRELTYEFDGREQKITDYFKSLNNLRKLPECYNYAPIINSMHRDLRKNNLLYKEFYLAMVNFEITNTDCIYYNDIGAATGTGAAAAGTGAAVTAAPAAAAKQDGGKRRRNKTRKMK